MVGDKLILFLNLCVCYKIYCFFIDFDTILIRCYEFGPSHANGYKTSLFMHMNCSFVTPLVPDDLYVHLSDISTIFDPNKHQK